jgi:hypothetical protein
MSYEQWLAEAITRMNKQAVGYGEVRDLYSFRQAYEDGMTPTEAVNDCLEWLEIA